MADVPITRLEAQLELSDNRRGVIAPPMPVRRRISIEEFEAEKAQRALVDKAYRATMLENEAKLRERGMGMFWKY